MLRWVYDADSHQGKRAYQEDCFASANLTEPHQPGLLLVLADGMGGARGGAIASRLAITQFIKSYCETSTGQPPERLWQALNAANQALAFATTASPNTLGGMGCTLLAVVVSKIGLYWISVGDSPLWLWRKSSLTRLNQDHSYRAVLAQQVSNGDISAEQAATNPHGNALLSVVTGDPLTTVDLSNKPTAILEQDKILLASDGLLTLSENQIAAILEQSSDESGLSQQLIQAVLQEKNQHQDNITVMLAQTQARPTTANLVTASTTALHN